MKGFEEYLNEIKVDFYEVKSGWINFNITVKDDVYEESFSYVFDPILDFKNWLEAVCTDVQQTSFTFNPEGNYIRFEIYRSESEIDSLVIREAHERGRIFIDKQVDRMQVVNAFYKSFVSLIESEKFDQKEWLRGIDLFEFKSEFIESRLK